MFAKTIAAVCLGGVISAVTFSGCERASAGGEKTKAAGKGQTGFSFAVYGDSRSMMYLPYQADEEAEARKLMVDIFSLSLPETAAEATVKKHVKLTYEPATKELARMVMPFLTASEVTTLTFDKGSPFARAGRRRRDTYAAPLIVSLCT